MTARHFEPDADLKQHVEARSAQFGRFFENIIDLHWLLEVDKHRHVAETSAKVYGTQLTGRGEAGEMRAAVDEAAGRMEAQLKKYKARLKERDQKAIADAKAAAHRRGQAESAE
ncbi:MAG: ribosome-associated translation inhibitor RaiA [candidate division Zixibacteria bacterium]|nr:ribosome-associated translation inhibitor RaiA [candidate division Zixibacteria bacterium]